MAQKRNAASDADSCTLADLLGAPDTGAGLPAQQSGRSAPVEAEGNARQAGQGLSGDLPSLSDLADGINPYEFDDVLMDMHDTGEERDPDGFDDSVFFDAAPDMPEAPSPEAVSRTRRLAGVWQGRRRNKAVPAPETPEGASASEGLLEGVLANSNAAPPATATLDGLLSWADPLDDSADGVPSAAEAAAVAEANLALALAFSDEEDDDKAYSASVGAATEQEADPLADLLGPDLLDEDLLADDLLSDLLRMTEPPPVASETLPSEGSDDATARDQNDDWEDDLGIGLDDTPDESEYDWMEDLEDEITSESFSERQDDAQETAAAPVVAAMQDAMGTDLLADLLRDDDTVPVPPAAPTRVPVGTPTPVRVETPAVMPEPQPRREPVRRGGMTDLDHVLQAQAARSAPKRKWLVRLIWLVLLCGLIYVAFQPYRFEVGGEFVVESSDRAEARARTSGEITALHANEGDWVEADTVIAVLSNWNQTRDVSLIKSEGARLEAQLATLMEGSRPEEIAVAEQALASANLQLATRLQELERQETLFSSGTIALKAVEDARNNRDLAQSVRDQAAATLALVQAGPRQTEIDALKATTEGNAEELAFAELMLEYTNIRAPVSGRIVSSMNDVPLGHSLTVGGLLAEIEDNRTVVAELAVPEITIEEVVVGAPVELRLWSDPYDTITGTVRSIAPRAEEQDFGWVIRVQVEVPNPDGRLAANMTGFGKISAEERPVWQAFSRAIQRFFVIEVWSWLP